MQNIISIVEWGYQDNLKPAFFTKRIQAYKKYENVKQTIFTPVEVLCTQKSIAFVVFCALVFVFVG